MPIAGATASPAFWASTRPGRCPLATTSTSTAVAVVESVFTEPGRLARAGFLAGYTGLTREAYALDCASSQLVPAASGALFQARRADIECFARDLEARGRARATITRRVCTRAVTRAVERVQTRVSIRPVFQLAIRWSLDKLSSSAAIVLGS